MQYLVLIPFLVISMLNPAFSRLMPSDDCCAEHVLVDSDKIEIQTAEHGHQDNAEAEECCLTDQCYCHNPTNQIANRLSVFVSLDNVQDLSLIRLNRPMPVFLSVQLRPPIA